MFLQHYLAYREQANREEMYEKIYELMEPEINKLRQLMHFTQKAIARFCEEVKRLSHEEIRKDFISESYLLTLGKFVNMFAVLDELNSMKSSNITDHSIYKRACQFLKKIKDQEAMSESQNLSMFLATQGQIAQNLKSSLQKIQNYEDLFYKIISNCLYMYENKVYVTPAEKHMLVKIMGFCIYLMDSDQVNIYKLDQNRRLKFDKMDKIFQDLEYVPLFGDMQISTLKYVKISKQYDPSKWPLSDSLSTQISAIAKHPQANFMVHLPKMRENYYEYILELAKYSNEISTNRLLGTDKDNETHRYKI